MQSTRREGSLGIRRPSRAALALHTCPFLLRLPVSSVAIFLLDHRPVIVCTPSASGSCLAVRPARWLTSPGGRARKGCLRRELCFPLAAPPSAVHTTTHHSLATRRTYSPLSSRLSPNITTDHTLPLSLFCPRSRPCCWQCVPSMAEGSPLPFPSPSDILGDHAPTADLPPHPPPQQQQQRNAKKDTKHARRPSKESKTAPRKAQTLESKDPAAPAKVKQTKSRNGTYLPRTDTATSPVIITLHHSRLQIMPGGNADRRFAQAV